MNQSELIEKVAQATELKPSDGGPGGEGRGKRRSRCPLGRRGGPGLRPRRFQCGGAARTRGAESTNRREHRDRSQQGSAIPRRQGRQRCPQSADSEGGPPEEVRTTKEIRGAEVNVLSLCGRAGTAASALAVVRGASESRRSVLTTAVYQLNSQERAHCSCWTARPALGHHRRPAIKRCRSASEKGANEFGAHDRAPGTHAVNLRTKKSILASAALAGLDFGVHAAGYCEHAEFPVHSPLRLFVEPNVLRARAFEDAVDYHLQPLHPRLRARRAAAVIDDRPGTVLRRLPFDLPYELLPI